MKKRIQGFTFAIIVMAVLSAGTVSARQLSLSVQTTSCRGFCTSNSGCPNILGCTCVFSQPGTNIGMCNFTFAKAASSPSGD